MCGIVGSLSYGTLPEDADVNEKIRLNASIFLFTELLQLTQPRGKEATGVVTMFESGDCFGVKMGIPAQEFVARMGLTEGEYGGFVKVLREASTLPKISIGHCRKPSTTTNATTDDNANNHPIKVGDIFGVHNGTLTNHERIFNALKCGRDGKVDSEAIFRLLNVLTNNGTDPFSKESILETCRRLSGTFSVLTFNAQNPYQMAAFRDGRPLEALLIRPLKLLLLASEAEFFKSVLFSYNKMARIYDSHFPMIRKGDVDMGVMPDCHAFLFDIRQEVTATTKLEDIHQSFAIPKAKIWNGVKKVATQQTYATAGYNNGVAGNAAGTGTAVVKTDVAKKTTTQGTSTVGTGAESSSDGGDDAIDIDVTGMVFNSKTGKFSGVVGEKNTEEHPDVIINPDGGEVLDAIDLSVIIDGEKKDHNQSSLPVDKKRTQATSKHRGLTEVHATGKNETVFDRLLADPAKINELRVAQSPGSDDTKKKSKSQREVDGSGGIEVDFTTHPDALKRAEEITKMEPNFSNDAEVATALDITDPNLISKMDLYSLANRIKKYYVKKAYYAGMIAGQQEIQADNTKVDTYARTMLERLKGKQKRTQTTIRNLKVLVMLVSSLVSKFGHQYTMDRLNDSFEDLGLADKVNRKALVNTFSVADLKEMPIIEMAMATMDLNGLGKEQEEG